MIALIPVSLFQVIYYVGTGRPYSEFERLLLAAIGDGVNDLDKLVIEFRIHRRLIIEGVVTLMQARWIAIDPLAGQFSLTPAGERAVKGTDTPEDMTIERRQVNVVLECVSGQICRPTEVKFHDRHRLGHTESGVFIPASDIPNTLNVGMVSPFIRRPSGSWIHSIGPITAKRRNADYVLADVDCVSGILRGIPERWEANLSEQLIERVRRREEELRRRGDVIDDRQLRQLVGERTEVLDLQTWSVSELDTKIAFDGAERSQWIERCIYGDETYTLIHCTDLDRKSRASIECVLARQGDRSNPVDLLWSSPGNLSRRAALDWLMTLSNVGRLAAGCETINYNVNTLRSRRRLRRGGAYGQGYNEYALCRCRLRCGGRSRRRAHDASSGVGCGVMPKISRNYRRRPRHVVGEHANPFSELCK